MKRMKISPRMAAQLRGDVAVGDDDVASCARCGCTEDQACPGGCVWVPTRSPEDVCSSCATEAELAEAALRGLLEADL